MCALACTNLNDIQTLRKYIMNIRQQGFLLHLINQALSLRQMWEPFCHLLEAVKTVWILTIYQQAKWHVTMRSILNAQDLITMECGSHTHEEKNSVNCKQI